MKKAMFDQFLWNKQQSKSNDIGVAPIMQVTNVHNKNSNIQARLLIVINWFVIL